MSAIITAAAGYCLVVLFIIKGIKFVTAKPIEETREDLDFPVTYHDLRIVPKDKEPTIREVISV